MKPGAESKPNLALIAAVLFSAFCWVCVYAAFADFAQTGLELMTRPGIVHSLAGVALVGLHALGLLLVFTLAGGVVAALVRSPHRSLRHRHLTGTSR